MIEAKIILDSVNPAGHRLTTWLLTYPRFIHSEFLTHRVFSRNAASSRAIPVARQIQAVRDNPAMPEQWGANEKGMQAHQKLSSSEERGAVGLWNMAVGEAVKYAEALSSLGAHKQIANRIIEPWSHMTVLATATDHRNFFALRANPMAQPEFQVLAYRMLALYLASDPDGLKWSQWHLPCMDVGMQLTNDQALKYCVAMAARTSYSAFEDGMMYEDAAALHDRLATSGHWSPFEHCAQANQSHPLSNFDYANQRSGWLQYRKTFPNENASAANLESIMAAKPEWVKL